jgi:hypothetical protein
MQSRNQFCCAPYYLERALQVLDGENRKSRLSDCFSVLALSSFYRFNLVLHMILFPYCMCLIIKKNKKIWENLQDIFSIGISDIACVFT